MGDMHHVHRGIMSLEAPLCDDTGVHGFNSFAPYPQIPNYSGIGVPTMSWSATDPALLSIEQSSGKPPFSWQAESCLQQSLQYTHGGYNAVGQMEMIAALNADPYNPSANELSQMVQLYSSLYQDQYGYSNLSFMDPVAFQSDVLLPSSSECLQVVNSSGSDSLSTTETWRSETSGGCAPNYDQVLTSLNESSSVTLVGDSHGSNFQPQRQKLDVLKLDQATPLPPVQDSWIHNQLQADAGRSNMHTDLALTHDASSYNVTSYEVLPVASTSSPPTFKRPRTWDEALQQGSTGIDPLRYSLTSKTSLKLDCSLNSLSRAIPSRELRSSTRQSPFQGTLLASHRIGVAGSVRGSGYPRRLDLQEEGRFLNGKPAATSVEPQSVAARHRRKKISERIRVLEKLIPGGNKMDTATMLDEAIEYVKFLQLQVQILESDSLDDISVAAPIQTLPRSQGNSNADKHGSKRKFDTATGGDFSAAGLSLRAATSPLILSEVLQQQLFKQKLCLVSIRQCPQRTPNSTQGSQLAVAPSILRKK